MLSRYISSTEMASACILFKLYRTKDKNVIFETNFYTYG